MYQGGYEDMRFCSHHHSRQRAEDLPPELGIDTRPAGRRACGRAQDSRRCRGHEPSNYVARMLCGAAVALRVRASRAARHVATHA